MESEKDFGEEYEKLRVKFSLPSFERVSEDFEIEKLAEKGSNFLAREVRKVMTEKLSAYLQLFEMLMNPAGPPMFIFSILRNVNSEDKEKIKEVYKRLCKIQIRVMKLDAIYNEVEECKFIKESFSEWQNLKKIIYKIIDNFEENFEADSNSRRSGYVG